jgi:hypothetical protein
MVFRMEGEADDGWHHALLHACHSVAFQALKRQPGDVVYGFKCHLEDSAVLDAVRQGPGRCWSPQSGV